MKTNIIKHTLTLLLILAVGLSYSQENYSKKFEKTFNVNEETSFKLSNKYGKVHIETNNSDKVEIVVTINVEAKNEKKADDMFNKIEIVFKEESNLISAITEIDGNIKNTKINYYVKMPETLLSEISNKYGYTFIDKLKSNSTIICKYGKLQLNELLTSNLEKKAVVQLKYSKGTIEKCDYIDLDVKYSGINVNESRVVNLNSGYSNIYFDKAYIIKAISKYDTDFTINEVTKFVLDGKYSGYKIGKLHNTLKAFTKYSNLKTEVLEKDFDTVFVDSKYGNTKIYVEELASYKLNAKAEYGSINCYGKIKKIDSENIKLTSSFIGKDENSKSNIVIRTKYGNIHVK